MKRYLAIVFFLAIGLKAEAESLVVDFEQITQLVKEKNLHAKGADLLRQAAETGRGHLRRSYLPHLGAVIGQESYKTGTQDSRNEPLATAELSINIYNGGRDTLEEKIKNTAADIATFDAEQVYRREVEKARNAYWSLVAGRESLGLVMEAIGQNEREIQSARSRVAAGLATNTDVVEFEIYQIRLEQELASINLAIKNYELELAVLIGQPEDTEIKTSKKIKHLHNDTLLKNEFIVEQHPVVKGLAGQASSAILSEQKADKWYLPAVELYASHGLNTFREREFEQQSERKESVLGVQAVFNIFDGFESKTEAAQKRLEAAGRAAERVQSARELLAEVDNSKAKLKLIHQLIHKSEEALALAQTYLAATLEEYKKGVKNSPDVLSALEKNLELQLSFIRLRLDYQLARTDLLELFGQ